MAKPGTEHKCAQYHLNDLAAAPSMPADAAATHVPRAVLFRLPYEACSDVRFGCRVWAQMLERETAGLTSEWQGDCTLQQVNSRRFKASVKKTMQINASNARHLALPICFASARRMPHSAARCCLLGSLRKAHEVNALESSLPIQLNCMASDEIEGTCSSECHPQIFRND